MLAITLFIIWLSKSWSGSVLNFKVLVSVWALDTQVSVWVLRHHSLGLGLEHQSLGLEEFSLKSKAALSCTFLDILHSITKRDMQFFSIGYLWMELAWTDSGSVEQPKNLQVRSERIFMYIPSDFACWHFSQDRLFFQQNLYVVQHFDLYLHIIHKCQNTCRLFLQILPAWKFCMWHSRFRHTFCILQLLSRGTTDSGATKKVCGAICATLTCNEVYRNRSWL